MSTMVVVGAQWGDEGKGKLVDYLTANAKWVVRFQGGNNAGHTLVVDGQIFKLSLIPSGVLRPECRCVIGGGVVVDPVVLLKEIEGLARAGIEVTPERLMIDRDAQLILAYHCAVDKAREMQRGDQKLGTTGRGIGPAYEERASRAGVRFAELFDPARLKVRFFENVAHHNLVLKHVLQSDEQVDAESEWGQLEQYIPRLTPYVTNASQMLHHAIVREERVLFEGAQGTLLDQVFGTVPFVTSSHTLAGAVTVGCGIGPKSIDYVLGVAKGYSTRVGTGPFPTELHDSVADQIRKAGAEFGTVTGRPRRCGWLDAVALRRAVRLNGIDSLVLTKLDVLAGLSKVKICIGYTRGGQKLDDMPALAHELDEIEPHYIELEGWGSEIASATAWHKLPAAARLYVSTVSELVGCPVSVVSVGAERESTIFSSSATFLESFLEES